MSDGGGEGDEGDGEADAEVVAEADADAAAVGLLDDDEVGDAADEQGVAGEGRGEREGVADDRQGGLGRHEAQQEHHRRDVADQVSEQRDDRNQDADLGERQTRLGQGALAGLGPPRELEAARRR